MKEKDLIRKPNVVYVRSGKKITGGVKTDRDAVVVGVKRKVPLAQLKRGERIPRKVHGKETDVVQTDEIYALDVDRKARHRPAPGGVSIGHPKVTAGTLGMLIISGEDKFILSNNHVLANSNDAAIGDQTWQPGRHDGGSKSDMIGYLSRFVPIVFNNDESNCPVGNFVVKAFNFLSGLIRHKTRLRTFQNAFNLVDCAISRPFYDEDVSEEILEIGIPTGFAETATGEMVKKSGRTTGLTENVVMATDGIVNVNYGDGKIAVFEDQIMTGAMSEGGDSGSVVLNKDNKVVGLLFAGSNQVTIINKIQNVIEALELSG